VVVCRRSGTSDNTGGSRDAGGLDYTLERWIRQNDRMVLYGYYLYLRGRRAGTGALSLPGRGREAKTDA